MFCLACHGAIIPFAQHAMAYMPVTTCLSASPRKAIVFPQDQAHIDWKRSCSSDLATGKPVSKFQQLCGLRKWMLIFKCHVQTFGIWDFEPMAGNFGKWIQLLVANKFWSSYWGGLLTNMLSVLGWWGCGRGKNIFTISCWNNSSPLACWLVLILK